MGKYNGPRETHTRAELEAIVEEANGEVEEALRLEGKFSRAYREAVYARRHYERRLERAIERDEERDRRNNMSVKEVVDEMMER
jgi:hypothetical protein